MNTHSLDPSLQKLLACPRDRSALIQEKNQLTCAGGHSYPLVEGIPVLLIQETPPTQQDVFKRSLEARPEEAVVLSSPSSEVSVDAFVQEAIGATGGYMYLDLMGKLNKYPIPHFPLSPTSGKLLLDVGCNWGRWTCAAARAGYQPVGIDPNLEAIQAARRVSRQLGLSIFYLVADARHLPFQPNSFDSVFSYSVLQHFEKEDVRRCISEFARILNLSGVSFVQMLSTRGLRNWYVQAARGFRAVREFEVRYWAPPELLRAFSVIGDSNLSVDGFFSANAQLSDRDLLLPWRYRRLVEISTWLRQCSQRFPALTAVADSLYVRSVKKAAS